MAKATRKKKEEPIEVNLSSTEPTNIVEEKKVEEFKKVWVAEPGLEEMGAAKSIEPLELLDGQKAKALVEKYERPKVRREMDASLPFSERILAFLEGKSGTIRLNDFLKALYPVPRMNEIPKWANQAESKLLKKTLDDMAQSGQIKVANNMHRKLGSPYYTGDDQRLMHHNIATVNINVAL